MNRLPTAKRATRHNEKDKNTLQIEQFGTKNVIDIFTAKNHSFLLSRKNNRNILKAWGRNVNGQLGLGHCEEIWFPTDVDFFNNTNLQGNVKDIRGGMHHSLVIMDNNDLYVFGKNDESQCAHETKLEPAQDLHETVEIINNDNIDNNETKPDNEAIPDNDKILPNLNNDGNGNETGNHNNAPIVQNTTQLY